VRVFLFRVERQLDDWPEKSARETRWFDAEEAAELVEEGGLAEIIKGFAGSHVRFVAYDQFTRLRAIWLLATASRKRYSLCFLHVGDRQRMLSRRRNRDRQDAESAPARPLP
jgi:hypothetical protein